jgi:hypothetical protein
MTENTEPKKVFVGYEDIGGVRVKKWKYVNLKPRPRLRTDDLFQEPTWEVRREGSKYLFEFLAARQGGGTDSHEITQEEFEAVKAEDMSFEDLLRKYDR